MIPQSQGLQQIGGSPRRRLPWKRIAAAFAAVGIVLGLFLWHGLQGSTSPAARPTLSAPPSPELNEAVNPRRLSFSEAVVDSIQRLGHVTVTVHVALADHRLSGASPKFSDGDNPTNNLYWGARYGVEAYLTRSGGWKRVYADHGDGQRIVRRVVLRRRAGLSRQWQDRGVNQPFDVYLLANAWRGSDTVAAMEEPLREALSGRPVELKVQGADLEFGGGSTMVGYVGYNRILDQYWDPFADLPRERPSRQIGVFYIAPRSAVVLHSQVVKHGLYPVLFPREPIVPEAYLLDGILDAFSEGDLDDGFIEAAAREYARFQKDVSLERAQFMLYR